MQCFALLLRENYLMGIMTMYAICYLLRFILRIYLSQFKEILLFAMREQNQPSSCFI